MMERCISGRKDALIEVNSADFGSTLNEKHPALLAQRDDFIGWVQAQIDATMMPEMREGQAKNNVLDLLVRTELTFSLDDWADKWLLRFGNATRAPAARIEELIEKYAHMAGDQEGSEWGEPVEITKPTPAIHDIIQRGFKAQVAGDGEAQIIEELQDFIRNGGDLEQRDNSRMTALQRCKMLGWQNGKKILEEATVAA